MNKYIFGIVLLLISLTILPNLRAEDTKIRVEVIYFHATERCQGCLTIESLTEGCIKDFFAKELKDSTVIYSSIDFLQTGNEHFQDDYKFDFQTLILRKKVNGKLVKWKNLDKIWDLYGNPEKYTRYVELEVKKMLKAKD